MIRNGSLFSALFVLLSLSFCLTFFNAPGCVQAKLVAYYNFDGSSSFPLLFLLIQAREASRPIVFCLPQPYNTPSTFTDATYSGATGYCSNTVPSAAPELCNSTTRKRTHRLWCLYRAFVLAGGEPKGTASFSSDEGRFNGSLALPTSTSLLRTTCLSQPAINVVSRVSYVSKVGVQSCPTWTCSRGSTHRSGPCRCGSSST
jgi:hypothetical protein